jgi:hypothetical protein
MAIRKAVMDGLECYKSNIKDSYQYNMPNCIQYNDWMKFIFQTTLSGSDLAVARELKRTSLEFNMLEAYINKICGEFAKQEPSIEVRQSDNPLKQVPAELTYLLEGYFRAILDDCNKDNLQYLIFREMVAGGFSAAKVCTEYESPMSFNQNIVIKKVFDPTLCGWDKMARESHKGDGEYCFELFPMTKDMFESKYGTKYTKDMDFTKNISDFSWCYSTDHKEIILVGDYYKKVRQTKEIVLLADNRVMTTRDYDRLVGAYEDNPSMIEMPPATIGKSRKTELVTIDRITLIEKDIIDHEETDYEELPIIFFDGNSVLVKNGNGGTAGASQQLTRPYVYQARGIQRLKNYAGNSLATELENMVMLKWIAMEEAIPPESTAEYINVQKPGTLIYKGFKDGDPNVPLAPPQAIQRPAIPQEITNTFSMSDQMTQGILGSYDASLGINDNNLSGVAIENGSTNSNHASMPYVVGYMRGLNQIATAVMKLIPKYINLERNISIKDIGGKRQSVPVNSQNGISLDYDSSSINVKVEAGVNFELQRQQAFQALTVLMKTSPILQEYISTEEAGIEMLLNNVDVRGIDALKQNIKPFIQKIKQRQQQSEQMAQKQAQMAELPLQIKQQEMQQKQMQMQLEAQSDQAKVQVEAGKLEVAQQDSDTKRMLALAEIGEKTDKITLEQDKMQQEESKIAVSELNAAVGAADLAHRHAKEILDLHHTNERHGKELEHKKEEMKHKTKAVKKEAK